MNEARERDNNALVGALDHARGMANFASEVRMRNFNFYIVIVGALVTGHLYLKESWALIVLGASGCVVSVFFFGLDLRMRAILKRSIDQLDIIEPEVWSRAEISGWRSNIRSGPVKFASHQWIYRSFFVLTGLGSFALLVRSLL